MTSLFSRANATVSPSHATNVVNRVGDHVMVTFFTTTFPVSMPEQSFIVPLNTLPDGLSTLVSTVLEVDGQRFDFLYNDEFISTSLVKFLRRRGLSHEELLNLEYTPALAAKEGALLPHDDWVSSVRAPVRGVSAVLLTGSYDRCVRVWDGARCVAVGARHTACVKAVCVRPPRPTPTAPRNAPRKRSRSPRADDFDCVSGGKDGRVVAWRFDAAAQQLRPIGAAQPHLDGIDAVDVSPDGALLATAAWDGTVRVLAWAKLLDATPPPEKAPLVSFTDHTRAVLACRFAPTGGAARLYSAGLDGAVRCLDVDAAALVATHRGAHAVQCVAVKPAGGGDLLLTACTDSRARLYDTRQRDAVKAFTGHRQWLYAVDWIWGREEGEGGAPHGFATASEDGTVRVWDLRATATALLTLDTLHTDGVLDVSYAGDAQIVSCGKDNKTRSFHLSKEYNA